MLILFYTAFCEMKFETCQKHKSLRMKYLSPDAGISLVGAKGKIY